MAEIEEKYHAQVSIVRRIWAAALTRRLVGVAGLAMIFAGYGMIMNTADMTDVEAVTRRAVAGMMLVFCGGVIEMLVMMGWSKR